MNPVDFIFSNIQKTLIAEGYTTAIASLSARHGVNEYKRRSQPTRRGHIYDDCLHEARRKAKAYKRRESLLG